MMIYIMYDKEEPPCLQYLIQIFGMAQHYPMPQLMQHCVSLCPIVFLGTWYQISSPYVFTNFLENFFFTFFKRLPEVLFCKIDQLLTSAIYAVLISIQNYLSVKTIRRFENQDSWNYLMSRVNQIKFPLFENDFLI